MTDRVSALTITLDHDMRVDDAQVIIDAIRLIRGVGAVTLGVPTSLDTHLARQKVAFMVADVLRQIQMDLIRGNDPSERFKKVLDDA